MECMAENKFLKVKRMNYLTPGQNELYVLIVDAVRTGKELEFESVKKIWLNTVRQDIRNGIPYVQWHDYQGVLRSYDLNENMIRLQTINWLSRNIGCLVLKGKLKVIPDFDWDKEN